MEEKKELVLTGTQKFQVDIINLVEKGLVESGAKFTEYGRTCVINAMAAFITICRTNDYDLKKIDQTSLKIALQNVGFTELNFAATPAEAYYDIRKTDNGYSVAIKPQGAGNEKLTRKFGVNLKELKTAILVREGDEYTLPGFDGEKMTPFKWQPKSLDSKVIMVVYPVVKNDDSIEYLMATREGIKPNLIAQVRQSNIHTFKTKNEKGYNVDDVEKRDQFYEMVNTEFEKLTVDQILANPEWRKQLSPTYTSGGSVESMILRKIKNNALKNYPREFDNTFEEQAYRDMWEDRDDTVIEHRTVIDADPIETVEKEIQEQPQGDVVSDFEVGDDGEVKKADETVQEKTTVSKNDAPKDNYEEDL